MHSGKVGLFDSGVGGLTVLQEVRRLMPAEDLLYFADQEHVPYGQRPPREVRRFSEEITRFLLAHGAKVVAVACNTASGAALQHLRDAFPQIPFVGMEPAVKPAAQESRARRIGVVATRGTFEGGLFGPLVDRYARDVHVFTQACPGLVEEIEGGDADGPRLRALLRHYLAPLLDKGIDALVLGCTHYPFARAAIEEIVGPGVRVVDPAPAVACQVQRLLSERGLLARKSSAGSLEFVTSADPGGLRRALRSLLAIDAEVRRAEWVKGRLADESAPPAARGGPAG